MAMLMLANDLPIDVEVMDSNDSTISSVAHYDNTAKNRFNPGPNQAVQWSEQSWDEMYLPFILYTADREAVNTSEKVRSPQR